MSKSIVKHTIRFFILLLTQVLVLNNVLFLGYINPYIYILFIMLLPFDSPRWLLLILAFSLGICVDAFQDSMGLHAFACVLIAYFRTPILHFLLPQLKNKKQTNLEFSLQEFGLQRALIYTGSMVLIHHFALFTLEAFRPELLSIFLRTISSAAISILLLIIVQYLLFKDAKR
tara:strand:- start:128 stop:646 length:519 start_codon:yes stop_codon:yes gene_type:complete